jgi:allantoicase
MTTHITNLPDLASRALGGSVSAANDELFAQRENLIRAAAPAFDPHEFGHKGKVYDGWETRRRRDQGHDYAIVRLGAAGIIHGVVIDTAYFKGNYPPHISVEATSIEGYPRIEEVANADWQTIVVKSPAEGDTANIYAVTDRHRWTHVRLSIYPDGGVTRLRVHGEVVPDPRFLQGTIDLLAAENGGRLIDCSDAFYASPANIILPGRATNMGEGWENARRRGAGNDYALFALAATGRPRYAVVDTSYYVGNAPGSVRLSTIDTRSTDIDDEKAWRDLLPRTQVQPDTQHRFLLDDATSATHLRLDVYPDGGLSRLRLFGDLDTTTLSQVRRRWWDALPVSHQSLLADQ